MGISYTTNDSGWDGNNVTAVVTGAFDASYTAGGESLAAADVGMGSIERVVVASGATESGYVARHDAAAGTIQLFEENASAGPLAEVAGGTDVSSETVRLHVYGRS